MNFKLLSTGFFLLGSALGFAENVATDTRPNILFILSDDHTSQTWGIYGGLLKDYVINDNIKKLAEEGAVLDNCFCTNSLSSPSRASIYTGRYSHKNGVYTLLDTLDTSLPTFAKEFQKAGYHTGLVGKWHLRSQPQGFDYYSVFHGQGEYWDPTFKDSDKPWLGDICYGMRVNGFATDIVTNKAIQWMKKQDKSHPFLMCCQFKAVHEPYDFPPRMKHLFEGITFPEPENLYDWGPETNGRKFEGLPIEHLANRWITASIDPENGFFRYPELPFSTKGLSRRAARKKAYQKLVRDYLRCAATVDENIGKLLKALDDMGIADNTIVVYVADQGYFLGEHGMYDKRAFYEEAARMPFVIRYPKKIKAGTRVKDLILNVDFASTLTDFAGIKAPEGSQGHSFKDILVTGKTPKDWRKTIYYRYWTHNTFMPSHIGVRNDRYKLMFLYGDPLNMKQSQKKATTPAWEFYDLKEDPKEDHNAYHEKKYEGIIREMKKEMMRLRNEVEDNDEGFESMDKILKSENLL